MGGAENVEDAPEQRLADRHGQAVAGALHRHAATDALGGIQRDAAHLAVVEGGSGFPSTTEPHSRRSLRAGSGGGNWTSMTLPRTAVTTPSVLAED